jgi:hypothetical protein
VPYDATAQGGLPLGLLIAILEDAARTVPEPRVRSPMPATVLSP